jgi:diguanylate cyclase (GGDEF)-like protein
VQNTSSEHRQICLPEDAPNKEYGNMIENYGSKWLNLVDEDSGLYNRLYLIHYLNETFARSLRYGTPVSCLLIKSKWWGKSVDILPDGEFAVSALQVLASFLARNVREGDILGRWSTDEFLLVAANTSIEGMNSFTSILSEKREMVELEGLPDVTLSIHAGTAGLPGDKEFVRYAEAMPLLARERLAPIFKIGRLSNQGSSEK